MIVKVIFGLGLIATVRAASVDCHVSGACVEESTAIANSNQHKEDDCIKFCRETEGCKWYTFNKEDGNCEAFETCKKIANKDCPTCLSGQVECPLKSECNINGKCEGTVFNIGHANNSRACHKECKHESECHWYTYAEDICVLLKTYDELNEDCNNCVCGKKECHLVDPCPPNWDQFGQSCYMLTKHAKSFDKTRKVCQTLDADLAVVKSKQQHDFIHSLMKAKNITNIYLGATDRESESHFKWVDGTMVDDGYTKWDENQPDDQGKGHENCLEIRRNRWNDIGCNQEFLGACQKPTAF
jgi:hypothetical protein